jgi:hypothetical protein
MQRLDARFLRPAFENKVASEFSCFVLRDFGIRSRLGGGSRLTAPVAQYRPDHEGL